MNPEDLKKEVTREIDFFEKFDPQVTADIDAIHVFSGPGTFLTPLKERDEDWMAWFDQARLSKGILLVLQVTSLRTNKPLHKIAKEDIEKAGPYLIYNGIPIENKVFRSCINLPDFPIPQSKIIIADEIEENGTKRPIKHTGDQVATLPTHLLGNEIKGSIALVSNAPHFIRILRYLTRYKTIPEHFSIIPFPIASRPDWAKKATDHAVQKLFAYLALGYLSEKPTKFEF